MADKAKVYQDQRGNFYVQLYWKGKQWRRWFYDAKMPTMPHVQMATRVAEAINADIDKCKTGPKAFDPRQWFKTPGYEFQFGKYAEKWLQRNRDRYAPGARGNVKHYAGKFIEFFGQTDIREIRKDTIIEFADWLPSHWAPKTKDDAVSLLHKLFSDAFNNEMIDRIPGFPQIEVPEPEIKWIPTEWQDRIIEQIQEKDRPIFIFIRTWGVRPGEARALMWDCVDFEKEAITIKRTFSGAGCNHLQEYTKTKRIRYLPFTDELRELFSKIRGIGGFVFRNRYGRPYTADLSRIWNEARAKAKCPYEVTLNQGTRHSFATQHLDKLDIVRQVLGHTSSGMTIRRYQAINMAKMRELKR